MDRPVREDDVVDRGVAPTSGGLVDDLEPRPLALKLADVEGIAAHRPAASARGAADVLSVDEQAQTQLARVGPAADPEVDEPAVDREFGAGELALVLVGGPGVLAVPHHMR